MLKYIAKYFRLHTVAIALTAFVSKADAQVISPSNKWMITTEFSSLDPLPYTMDFEDPRYDDYVANTATSKDRQILTYVRLGIDNDVHECYTDYKKYTFNVSISYEQWNGTSFTTVGPVHKVFNIEFDPTSNNPYRESAIYYLTNAYKVSVHIDSYKVENITTTITHTNTYSDLDNNIYLEVTTDAEQYNELILTTAPAFDNVTFNNTNNEIEFKWFTQTGATAYELEWTYVDDYDADATSVSTTLSASNIRFTFTNNATRVRVPAANTSFKIPAMYDRGWIVARIRAIGHDYSHLDNEVYTIWSHPQGFNDEDAVNDVSVESKCYITPIQSVNWMSSATFAEEAKNKFAVSYADGSSRTRQQVTLSSTEYIAIATETFYDHQGRASVQALPSPVIHDSSGYDVYSHVIKYYANLNRSDNTGNKYSRTDFDLDPIVSAGCTPDYTPFKQELTTGYTAAGHYYSTENGIKTGAQAYVPDANGYPFTVTQFTPDNTGRIARQSGVGVTHMIGSGHETQYFYGTPTQVELDRLFGTDAGFNTYYQKNMVIDANGQVSVSYIDMAGKTVATSLAGAAPDNVAKLVDTNGDPLADNTWQPVTEDMLHKSDDFPLGMTTTISPDSMALSVSYGFLVTSLQPYVLDYEVEVEDFVDECIENICMDCVYDLSISVKDRCGNEMLEAGEYNTRIGRSTESLDLDSLCNHDNALSASDLTTVSLVPGEYTVIKKLKIVEESLDYYADLYMKNSTCLLDTSDFYTAPDLSGCNFDCDACNTLLTSLGETVTDYLVSQSVDGDTLTLGDEERIDLRDYYYSVVGQCAELCAKPSIDNCAVLYQTMLSDMAPGGQYATYAIDGTTNAVSFDDELSVLDENNKLPQRYNAQFAGPYSTTTNFPADASGIKASWRNPLYYKGDGQFERGYFDEDEHRVIVYVELNLNETPGTSAYYIPNVLYPAQVTYDAATDRYYTYPENLLDVTDFISIFSESYAKSLLVYHPEFFAYDWCANRVYEKETVTLDGSSESLNSNEFDYYLKSLDYTTATAVFGSSYDIISYDPLFIANATYAAEMSSKMSSFMDIDGHTYNAWETAYITEHYTGGYSSISDINVLLHNVSTGVCHGTCSASEVIISANEWNRLVDNYLSAKQAIITKLTQAYIWESPRSTACYCIGTNPSIAYNIGTYANANACASATYNLYRDKQPRFADPAANANATIGADGGDDLSADELQALADNQYYQLTGICPVARDIGAFFTALVRDNVLTTTSSVNLTERPYLSQKLHDLFTSYAYLPTISTNRKLWTWDLPVSGSCSTPLTLSIPPGLPSYVTLDNITQIFDLHDVTHVGSTRSAFKIRVYATDGTETGMFTIDGLVCLDLLSCPDVINVNKCTVGVIPNSILSLMNTLAADDHLDATSQNLTAYNSLISPEIRALMGPGTLYWKYNSTAHTFTIDKGTTTPAINVNISTLSGLNPAATVFFKRIYSAGDQIGGSPSSSFKLDFYQTLSPPVSIEAYTPGSSLAPTGVAEGTISFDDGSGATDLEITSCTPMEPLSCNAPENKNLRQLEDLFTLLIARSGSSNAYYDAMPCIAGLKTSGDATPDFTTIAQLVKIVPDMSQSYDGVNTNYFTAIVQLDNGLTENITGQYCHPIRSCEITCNSCEPEDSVTIDLTVPFDLSSYLTGTGVTLSVLSTECFGISPRSYFVPAPAGPAPTAYDVLTDWVSQINTASPGLHASVEDTNHLVITLATDNLLQGCSCADNKVIRMSYAYDDHADEILPDEYYKPLSTDNISCCQANETVCVPTDSVTLVYAIDTTISPNDSLQLRFGGLNASCVLAGIDSTSIPLWGTDSTFTAYLSRVVTAINTASPYIHAALVDNTISIKLSTTRLEQPCTCGSGTTLPAYWYRNGEREGAAAVATIACCAPNGGVADCRLYIDSLQTAYAQALSNLEDDYDDRFKVWEDNCINNITTVCNDSLNALYSWYNTHKALVDTLYINLIKDATADCAAWASAGSITFVQCDNNVAPFPNVGTPYVDPCQQDLQGIADANARYRFEQYLLTERAHIKRRLRNHCLTSANEAFSMSYHVNEYHFTLYYYDQAGNLYRTVPPKAVTPFTSSDSLSYVRVARLVGSSTSILPQHAKPTNAVYSLVTEYRFNSLNQPVQQHTPDGGTSKFWYDNLGRLIYSQNAKQAPNNQYSYTKFDSQGRIVEVGQLENADSPLTQDVASDPSALATGWEPWSYNFEQVTYTFYDIPVMGFTQAQNLRKRVAATVYMDNPASGVTNSATLYSYDILGNVKQLWQYNSDLPSAHQLKTMYYYYDLVSGKVNSVAYQPEGKDCFFHKYKYDADNRIVATYTWDGGGLNFNELEWNTTEMPLALFEHTLPFDEDARYFYYDHGPLARTELGDLNVQGLDYTYNLQGWIKGVNSVALKDFRDPGLDGRKTLTNPNRFIARDAYSYSLTYFDGDYSAIDATKNNIIAEPNPSGFGNFTYLYNGNIAAMTTTLKQPNNNVDVYPQGMVYSYDQLNRIKNATAYTNLNRTTNQWGTETPSAKYYNEFTYDANGNILTQLRNDVATSGPDLDDLTYHYYAGTNQLEYVDDAVSSSFTDDIDDQSSGNYTYDPIGNMISDTQGDISNIDWTVYGKIKNIDKGTGGDISFTYAPDGNRISKLTDSRNTYYVRDASGNIMATYTLVGDCFTLDETPLYGSSRLGVRQKEICLDDTIVPDTGTVGIVYQWRGYKKYELSNHLGNVLTVIADTRTVMCDSDDYAYYEADIISVTDYYAFGSPMAGRTHSQSLYRFGFNGKENDGETSLQDYGLRIYNSALGKFLSADPLFKDYPWNSTYAFAENDVMRCIDLDGGEKKSISTATFTQLRKSQLNLINAKNIYNTNPAMYRELSSNYDYAFNWCIEFMTKGKDLSAYTMSRYMGGQGGIDIFSYDQLNKGALNFKVWGSCKDMNKAASFFLDDFAKNNPIGVYKGVTFETSASNPQSAAYAIGTDLGSAVGSFEVLSKGTFDIQIQENGNYTILSGTMKYTFRDTYKWHPEENRTDGDDADHKKLACLKYIGAKPFYIRGYWESTISGSNGEFNRSSYKDSIDYSGHPDSKNEYYSKPDNEKVINDFR